jgi:hypothetical protein
VAPLRCRRDTPAKGTLLLDLASLPVYMHANRIN